MSTLQKTLTAGLAALLGILAGASLGLLAYPALYHRRVYPGVSVGNVELGGLTEPEAALRLCQGLPEPAAQGVDLRFGDDSWRLTWAEAGQTYDCDGTAAAAYEVGRHGNWHQRLLIPWRIRFQGRWLEPLVVPADPSRVREALQALAAHVDNAPTDAQLQIHSDEIDGEPRVAAQAGDPGTTLDVETGVARVLQGLADGATEIELTLLAVPPSIPWPEPAYTQVRLLLSEPFTLIVDDPLTDHRRHLEAPPGQVATWLVVTATDDAILLDVDDSRVRAWLLDRGPQLEPERELVVDETLAHTLAALRAGQHEATAVIRHPENSYLVKAGDTLFDIAYRHGFPQWRLQEANPDVEPHELHIGMELTIPSIDILFPEPVASGKRIEIDLSRQRLRAYEEDALVHDFIISSGMASSPTIPGLFQVLFKEPQAYAGRWGLDMPYFLAIYYERPGLVNGIHELPINAAGQRLWAGVLGQPASYGCIILDVGDAANLYDWAPVGTLVRIDGGAPDPAPDRDPPGGIND